MLRATCHLLNNCLCSEDLDIEDLTLGHAGEAHVAKAFSADQRSFSHECFLGTEHTQTGQNFKEIEAYGNTSITRDNERDVGGDIIRLNGVFLMCNSALSIH